MTAMTQIARHAIGQALGLETEAPADLGEEFASPGAAFVTLTIAGQLRGCIGSLAARRPLGEDIAANARAAAFADPRFPPLSPTEFQAVEVEVSVLSPAVPLAVTTREEAEASLRPGIDGVILTAGPHRATFLPQVWEQLPDPHRFLSHLLAKAGLPPSSWPDGTHLQTYGVTAYTE